MDPKHVRHAVIEDGKVILDGEEFPFLVHEDGPTVTGGSKHAFVRIEIPVFVLADYVEVRDAEATTAPRSSGVDYTGGLDITLTKGE